MAIEHGSLPSLLIPINNFYTKFTLAAHDCLVKIDYNVRLVEAVDIVTGRTNSGRRNVKINCCVAKTIEVWNI